MLNNVLAFLSSLVKALLVPFISYRAGSTDAKSDIQEQVIKDVEKGNKAIKRARDNPSLANKLHDKYLK